MIMCYNPWHRVYNFPIIKRENKLLIFNYSISINTRVIADSYRENLSLLRNKDDIQKFCNTRGGV